MLAMAMQHGTKSQRMSKECSLTPFQKGCGRMKKKSTRLLPYEQKRVLCSEFSSVVRGKTVLMLSTCAHFTVAGINSRQKDTAFSEKQIKRHTPAPPN